AMNKQISDLRQRLQTGGDKLSAEETQRLTRQGEALAKQLQRKQEDFQEDVNAAQQEAFDRIGRKMMDVLDRYSRENGYVAVFDTPAKGSPIIYATKMIEVTKNIIRLYNQAYRVKAGAPPAKNRPPANPAPTTTPTKP